MNNAAISGKYRWKAQRVRLSNTLQEVHRQATTRLAISPQSVTARRDAELLLLQICKISRTDFLTHPEQPLAPAQLEAYFQAVERRAQSEPIQYITGVQEFYGLEIQVTPAVLIPRPETEHLVEAAIRLAHASPKTLRILDIGTGSGAIAVARACNLPEATFLATDTSSAALLVAARNAAEHGVAERITFAEIDLLPPDAGMFDMVCSNPPYIADGEFLETQVVAFEPHAALFAGPTGLEFYQRLLPRAASVLRAGKHLLLEIGFGQSVAIKSLFAASDWEGPTFLDDLQGIPRVAIAQKV